MTNAKKIRRVLVANRGEIASRIFRTCRRLGVESVAVFSDADADLPFVRHADEAIRIGAAAASESYLNTDAVLSAAKRAGADAIHPGYGFLAENAEFAEAVRAAGLIFVGPSSDTMRAVGAKREAKAAMMAAGVPVVPGYDGSDPSSFAAEATRIGYPLLIKASAGGGGKGMKRVDSADQLEAALESARRESQKAFGDSELILERYIDEGRHVEVQIAGDADGNVAHLYERDCSVQRRHQKVVEESPAPGLSDELRSAIHAAAVKVGRAVSYANVGTVEFIVQGEDFFFLEVNARLQVEHAVTEDVLGIDLVEWQLGLAEGRPLPAVPTPRGASVEVRLYAEGADYLPQTGTVLDWNFPSQEGVRIDSAVESGSEVSVHYDPMLAKVIARGDTRDQAIARLRMALRRCSILGITTNRDLLISVLESEGFVRGGVSTHFLNTHAPQHPAQHQTLAIVVAMMRDLERGFAKRSQQPSVSLGFSNNPRYSVTETWTSGEREFAVSWRGERDSSISFRINDGEHRGHFVGEDVEVDGRRFSPRVRWRGDDAFVSLLGESHHISRETRFAAPGAERDAGTVVSPMPGTIVTVHVSEGDSVEAGAPLIVVEAMKMEHVLVAAEAGIVQEIRAKSGDAVDAGVLLVKIE
ncbi:MAG: biotin carboxylase N-terminal domain-containing protein [Polyangiales bacterium]